MHTKTRTTTLVAALLDQDMPALVPERTILEPDFYDEGKAWWIGTDAVVGYDALTFHLIGDILVRGGWLARRTTPADHGITVEPLNPAYHDVSSDVVGYGDNLTLWRLAQRTVLIDL